ncbi:hypothetical protein ACQP1P_22175 [Dactylosporangium sp. CA-052675]|uniref:hypothetical protein n=1 Tax=Dactylosporangium sp. CA-052675 TaxID=3239927 RepID=UPI003D8C07CA
MPEPDEEADARPRGSAAGGGRAATFGVRRPCDHRGVERQPVIRRPCAVTVSSWLLVTAALLSAADLVLSYHGQQVRDEAYRAAVEAGELDIGSASGDGIWLEGACIVLLWSIGTVFLAVIAVQNLRGRPVARNTTWMLAGLMPCCPGVRTASWVASLIGGASIDPVDQRMDERLPDWYSGVAVAVFLGLLACMLTAAVLLALRSAGRYLQSARPPAPS